MPASKIKNLIILILALANLFLLALVLPARREQAQRTQQEKAQIAALFAEAGVTLDAASVPQTQTLYPLEVTCSEEGQIAAVSSLLGESVTQTQTAYALELSGENGRATLEPSGTLEVLFGGTTAAADVRSDAQARLKETGLNCTALRLADGGQTAFAYFTVSGAPIFTDPATFTYKNDTLIRFSALLVVPQSVVRTDQTPGISAQDALLAFYGSRMETGWVGSSIIGVTQGYTAKAAVEPQTVRLTPCWRIETDTGAFLIDGITAAVSAE